MYERWENEGKRRKEFEKIALQHMENLYRSALRMTGDGSDAQDLVQDTYLRAWRFFHKFESGTDMKSWLFTILYRLFINHYRKERKKPMVINFENEMSGVPVVTATPEDEIIGELIDDAITKAINDLPEEYRLAVMLSMQGFSYKEMAEILECPIGTVMSRLHRGRKLLRKPLAEYAKKFGYSTGKSAAD